MILIKQKTIQAIVLMVTIVMLQGCNSHPKEQTINISGAFALYPLVVQWSEIYQKEHPEIRFNISGGGAGKGMADALSGAVDLGMFSREITQVEKDKGVWWVGLSIDAVIPTISSQNPYLDIIHQHGLTQEEFKTLFIDGTITSWKELFPLNEDQKPVVYTRSDACGAAGTWAQYMGGEQEDLKGIGIFGDPGLAEAVIIDPLGVGFNNTIYIYDIATGKKRKGIDVIPVDINENDMIDAEEAFYDSFQQVLSAIAEGKYPSPPARELYFVANGQPQKQAVKDFIKWTLTAGQNYVKEAGYVPVDSIKLQSYLDKLR